MENNEISLNIATLVWLVFALRLFIKIKKKYKTKYHIVKNSEDHKGTWMKIAYPRTPVHIELNINKPPAHENKHTSHTMHTLM